MRREFPLPLVVVCLAAGALARAGETFDPDDLPRTSIKLPSGEYANSINHLNTNFRVSNVKELEAKSIRENDTEICLEAKFAVLEGEEIKLLGTKARVVCQEAEKLKRAKTFQRFDNIWMCGTLAAMRDGKGVELRVTDIQRMGSDLQLAGKRLALYENNKDFQALLELAKKITENLAGNTYDFNQTDQFQTLKARALNSSLTLREKVLAADDAAGLFKLARDWKELLNRPTKYAELIKKVLAVDPDHPNATRVAVEELDMVKLPGGGWVTKEERDRLLAEEIRIRSQQDTERKVALEARARQREEAIRDRSRLLSNYLVALRTTDPKALEGALRSLGEAVQATPDPVFAQQGIEILAQIQDPCAVLPGLELSTKSEYPEVRRSAYEALAWRADEAGLRAVSAALAKERDLAAAKAAVEALVLRGGKPALKTLVDSLASDDNRVVAELIEGLKTLSTVSHPDKEGWRRWWETQKDKP